MPRHGPSPRPPTALYGLTELPSQNLALTQRSRSLRRPKTIAQTITVSVCATTSTTSKNASTRTRTQATLTHKLVKRLKPITNKSSCNKDGTSCVGNQIMQLTFRVFLFLAKNELKLNSGLILTQPKKRAYSKRYLFVRAFGRDRGRAPAFRSFALCHSQERFP